MFFKRKIKKKLNYEKILEFSAELVSYLTILKVKFEIEKDQDYRKFSHFIHIERSEKQMETDLYILYNTLIGKDENDIKLSLITFDGWSNEEKKLKSYSLYINVKSIYEYYREFGALSGVDKKHLIKMCKMYDRCIKGEFDTLLEKI